MPLPDPFTQIDRLFQAAASTALANTRRNLATFTALATAASVHAQSTVYVDDDAAIGGDGTSWQTAFRDLQDALAATEHSDTVIHIAQGTYLPDRGTGSRFSTFSLTSGATLIGGFAGVLAADPDEHDPVRFVTVLSGDLGRNDDPYWSSNTDDNAYHVVEATRADGTPSLRDLTIRSGNANDPLWATDGAAILAGQGVNLVNCIVRFNGARGSVIAGTRIVASKSLFTENRVESGAVLIEANGVFIYGSQLIDNLIVSHSLISVRFGGHMAADSTIFAGNHADIRLGVHALGEFSGCTLADFSPSIVLDSSARISLRACILWPEPAPALPILIRSFDRGFIDINGCCIRAGRDAIFASSDSALIYGPDNFSDDPRFVGGTNPASSYSLAAGSPCIDRADSTQPHWAIDAAGNPRDRDDPGMPNFTGNSLFTRDVGAFEFQGVSCAADWNGQDGLSLQDLFDFLTDYFRSAADFNRSGATDIGDIFDFLAAYFAGCS